jgi:hypothetical protein
MSTEWLESSLAKLSAKSEDRVGDSLRPHAMECRSWASAMTAVLRSTIIRPSACCVPSHLAVRITWYQAPTPAGERAVAMYSLIA